MPKKEVVKEAGVEITIDAAVAKLPLGFELECIGGGDQWIKGNVYKILGSYPYNFSTVTGNGADGAAPNRFIARITRGNTANGHPHNWSQGIARFQIAESLDQKVARLVNGKFGTYDGKVENLVRHLLQ